jgi:hypothetical protein
MSGEGFYCENGGIAFNPERQNPNGVSRAFPIKSEIEQVY